MNYNLRHFADFTMPSVNNVCNGSQTISFLVQIAWGITPLEIKRKESQK